MEEKKRPYKAIDVANSVIKHFNNESKAITNLLLLKILYYLQADYLRKNEQEPLFSDEIEMWGYGPVVPSVYHSFKENGMGPINKTYSYIEEKDGGWQLIDADQVDLNKADKEEIFKLSDEIWKHYHKNPFELVEKTHAEPMWADKKEEIEEGQHGLKYSNKELHDYFSNEDNWKW
jgi:uncharacterized phage-associated protein